MRGRAHAQLRLFASPERRLVFDINDFDETLPGPWEWDVKRLSASLVIAGAANGFTGKERREIVTATVACYRRDARLRRHAQPRRLVRERRRGRAPGRVRLPDEGRQRKTVDKDLAKAKTRDSLQAFEKLTRWWTAARRSSPTRRCSCRSTTCCPGETDRRPFDAQLPA